MTMDAGKRWIALYVLCLATLMIVLDMTIVNVALPSIKNDLGFSETSLAWVVNGLRTQTLPRRGTHRSPRR